MLFRYTLKIEDLIEEQLDRIPLEIWLSSTTTFCDPAMGGGQYLRAVQRRLLAHGHSPANISKRIFGFESGQIRLTTASRGLYGTFRVMTAQEYLRKDNMKFNVIVTNPPFSSVKKDGAQNKGGEQLYTKFFKKAIQDADIVAMIMPSTDRKVYQEHNDLLREHANIIRYIDPKMFPTVNMPMWYAICDKSNPNKETGIYWALEVKKNDIPWKKGAIQMTLYKNLTGGHGDDKRRSKNDITIYHKINETNGLVIKYGRHDTVRSSQLFPSKGYALLLPQTFNDGGWSKTAIVKCDGRQAAFHGMTTVFFKTRKEAERLDRYMKTPEFIREANKVKQGFNNMNVGSLAAIDMSGYETF